MRNKFISICIFSFTDVIMKGPGGAMS